jgi:Bifunctional DNA primase/polymerase, N-terminal/Protein of unknown function (DUF3631)/Primase C terminal 1 (PriCT-1)
MAAAEEGWKVTQKAFKGHEPGTCGGAAVEYAEGGLPVFPLRGKVPRTKHGFKDASTNARLVAGWWAGSPAADVGIRTGGGLCVVDIDPRNGGEETFVQLAGEHGVPLTAAAETGGGGWHLFFRAPAGVSVKSRQLGDGVDLKAEGGYVVAPPSVHPETGRLYRWQARREFAELPAWLLDAGGRNGAGSAPPVADTIPEGARNSTLASLAGSMRRRAMAEPEILAALLVANEQRCQPPLERHEVERIAESVCRYAPAETLSEVVPLTEQPGAPAPPLAELLDAAEAYLRRYVVLTEAQYVVVALWAAHAHALDAASTTAYLHVTSAEAESGKSRLLEALEQLVPQPMYAASMTPAVLYRAVQKFTPTLLVDEADNLLRDREAKSELLGLLNAGYRRGALAYRIGGGNRDQLQSFETFCAKAVAGLDDLVATLASRCLRIEMERRTPDQHVEDFFRDEAEARAEPIRRGLAAWAEQEEEALRLARPARLGVRDRLEEACRLMLAIADQASEQWGTRAREALRELAGVSTGGALSERTQLLTDTRAVFADAGDPAELPTTELLDGLLSLAESPWRGWWGVERDGEVHAKPGAAQKLAAHLRAFKVRSHDVGPKEARRKGYRRADLEGPWQRYLPSPPASPPPTPRTPRTPSRQAKTEVSQAAHEEAGCAETGAAQTRMEPGGARGARLEAGDSPGGAGPEREPERPLGAAAQPERVPDENGDIPW